MITLGIETSCDETACAVLKNRSEIKANIVSSSLFRHRPFGGVVPEIASRHSLEQIDFVFEQAIKQAGIKKTDIDLIAVTQGPGLMGSLLVGVCFAKSLSYHLKLPLVGVNHLEGHLMSPFMPDPTRNGGPKIKRTPSCFVGLIVSGGHTIVSYHKKGHVSILGETVDDAVGEAYDKVGKILNLPYPGGPIVDRLAQKGDDQSVSFTKPKQKNRFDFSYSGIKTAVLYHVQKNVKIHGEAILKDKTFQKNVSASFQKAAVSWLVDKALDAAQFKKVKDVVVGGGVSANSLLRKRLTEEGLKQKVRVWFPPLSLTIDNAAMIARRGLEIYKEGKRASLKLTGNPNMKVA